MKKDPKDVKKRLKEDIKKLEKKKTSYFKKIEEITHRSDIQEQDLAVLKKKVGDEVTDLNKLNLEIDKEIANIQKMNKIKERKMHFEKTVRSQQQFNN